MTSVLTIMAAIIMVLGSAFALVAALGLIRFPDIYSRMHAASKAGSVGSGLLLIALALVADDFGTVTRALAGVVFFLLTAPLSAHLLAKAAYEVGYPLWSSSVRDDMPGQNDQRKV